MKLRIRKMLYNENHSGNLKKKIKFLTKMVNLFYTTMSEPWLWLFKKKSILARSSWDNLTENVNIMSIGHI